VVANLEHPSADWANSGAAISVRVYSGMKLGYIQSPIVRHVLSFCVAFAVSRTLFAAAGFHYDVFGEPFNAGKLAIDFGVWVVIYMVMFRALSRAAK
jgi:hypothetical protein